MARKQEAAAGHANHSDMPIGHRTRSQWGQLALDHTGTLTLALLKSFLKDLLKTETTVHRITLVQGKQGFMTNIVPKSHILHTTC